MPLLAKSIFIILFLSSFATNATLQECQSPLTLSTTSDWFPYIYQNEEGASAGVDVELLRIILNKMGCELRVVHFPERRSLFELNQGNHDIGLGASKETSRMKAFYYSLPYRNERNKFAYRASDADIAVAKNLQELMHARKVFAINHAGWYGEVIEKAKRDYPYFSFNPTAKKRLKMLNAKRVDIVIDDDVVLCSELLLNNNHSVKLHKAILFETPIHFIFSKTSVSSAFIDAFNKTLLEMKIDGSITNHYTENLPKECQNIS